ncbi:myb-like protein X [Macrosteles quadrilineatus]|uniref:myb-like protein X n=1 Tax=Macrosteles quadrilineatus TaxID=74068 RepID=UPI0023E236D0|nr:myb-like protein X [Macrosteles quadrilineatus]
MVPLLFTLVVLTWIQPSTEAVFCKPNSKYVHPLNCSKFIMCDSSGNPRVFICSKGLHYNAEKTACDWPTNANCTLDSPVSHQPAKKTVKGASDSKYSVNSNKNMNSRANKNSNLTYSSILQKPLSAKSISKGNDNPPANKHAMSKTKTGTKTIKAEGIQNKAMGLNTTQEDKHTKTKDQLPKEAAKGLTDIKNTPLSASETKEPSKSKMKLEKFQMGKKGVKINHEGKPVLIKQDKSETQENKNTSNEDKSKHTSEEGKSKTSDTRHTMIKRQVKDETKAIQTERNPTKINTDDNLEKTKDSIEDKSEEVSRTKKQKFVEQKEEKTSVEESNRNVETTGKQDKIEKVNSKQKSLIYRKIYIKPSKNHRITDIKVTTEKSNSTLYNESTSNPETTIEDYTESNKTFSSIDNSNKTYTNNHRDHEFALVILGSYDMLGYETNSAATNGTKESTPGTGSAFENTTTTYVTQPPK